jgi:HAE1 family hydrophobic/amphiphilic exporter-1
MVSGVAQVQCSAPQKYAVRVDVDPRKLSAHGIGIDEVVDGDQASNVNLPTGTMYGAQRASPCWPTASCSARPSTGPL